MTPVKAQRSLRVVGLRLLVFVLFVVITLATPVGPSLGRLFIALAVVLTCTLLGAAWEPFLFGILFLPYVLAFAAGDTLARWIGFIIGGVVALAAGPRLMEMFPARWRVFVFERRRAARLRAVEGRIRYLAKTCEQLKAWQARIEDLIADDPSNLGILVASLIAGAKDMSAASIAKRLGEIAEESERARQTEEQLQAKLRGLRAKKSDLERRFGEANLVLARLRDQDAANVEYQIRRLREGRENHGGDRATDAGGASPIAESLNQLRQVEREMEAVGMEAAAVEERLQALHATGMRLQLERCVLEKENNERKLPPGSDLSKLEQELAQYIAERSRLKSPGCVAEESDVVRRP